MRTLKLHFPNDAHPALDTCLKQTKAAPILRIIRRRASPGHGSTNVQSALVEPPGACMRQVHDFHISLRTALSIGIVAVLALTAAIVHVPWSVISRANIIDLNTRLNLRVIESISGRIDALLESAVAARDALAVALSDDILDVDDRRKRESLLLAPLLTQPGVTSIELALVDNRSTIVYRAIDGTIEVEETVAGTPSGNRKLDIYHVGGTGELQLTATQDGPCDYRPTEQFWYFTAFDKDRPTWSNIFKLPATGQFGVSTTRAITRDGELLGAIGVTIALEQISRFLDGIDISLGSSVFLTNNFGELVAVQARKRVAPMDTSGSSGIVTLEEVALPAVRTVVKALRDSHASLSTLARPRVFTVYEPEAGGTSFVTLAPLSQMGLIASVVIPEADVLGTINRNIHLLLLALAGFIVMVVVAAMILSRR
ncbi:MAG TPA: cache domain-containing protein, partial [Candidatus Binatia bacterium]|nr:cache domain-containing protein [Candidatus Binatia bacterium]